MKRLTYFFALTFILFSCSNKKENPDTKLPNIVIIYADDMGHGDLGVQNSESKIPTPNLDKLVSEGIRFTDGHSSSGICTPSRYALLTGRYHWRKFHGIVNSFGKPSFTEERLTMPEMLKDKGYATACIGKWHLGWNWNFLAEPSGRKMQWNREVKYYMSNEVDWVTPITGGPLSHGFDYYFGDDVPNFPPYTWIENEHVVTVPTLSLAETPKTSEGSWEARPGPMAEGWELDEVMPTLTKKAVEYIKGRKGRDEPFFLYFPWTSPHAPIVPTEEFQGTTEAGGYGDFMHQSDWTAGQVLKALEENGFAENTLVIFTADNGPEKYAYDRIKNYNHKSAGELRGLKRDTWEGGHRVPFVIKWPGVIEPGTVSNEVINQVDIMATLASVVGFELPNTAGEDSYNILPLLKGNSEAVNIREATVQNTFKDRYAIRKGDWVLIDSESGMHSAVPKWFNEQFGYSENQFPGELYNLKDDISQKNNLYGENPVKVAELKALLE
ncbi:MAG: arylsulfatase, partial [Bacteroidetes bacterium]|nr:arylsulfatase [Bacteroidota bacterium]